MISLCSKEYVAHLTAKQVYDFLLHCTDEQYNKWWPGTHLVFHTIKRTPGNIGNLVIMDEMIGSRRVRFKGVVVDLSSNHKIVWQMRKGVILPARLTLELADTSRGVHIIHTIKAGFDGVLGKITDPLLRLYFTKQFARDMDRHIRTEFNRLSVLLSRK